MFSSFIIIGGGPVGFFTAIGLAKRGYSSVVYEGRPNVDQRPEESYPIGVNNRGFTSLEYVDPELKTRIMDVGRIVDAWRIYGGKRVVAEIESGAVWSLSRFAVTKELYDYAVENEGMKSKIQIEFNKKLKSVDFSNRTLTFEDGTVLTLAADQGLIAADGMRSVIRSQLVAYTQQKSGTTPAKETLTPWNMLFRVLFVDKEAPKEWDPKVHYIYNGVYSAVIDATDRWTVVPSCLTGQAKSEWADWYVSNDPTPENVDKLRKHLCKCVPEIQAMGVDKLFTETELKAWFSRRIFTGVLTHATPLQFDRWVVILGDAAHGVFPPTGEGVNSGLEDVAMLMRAFDKTLPTRMPAATTTSCCQHPPQCKKANDGHPFETYSTYRQPDVDALHEIAKRMHNGSSLRFFQAASVWNVAGGMQCICFAGKEIGVRVSYS
jgi:kynurenine 3-monooxygenase